MRVHVVRPDELTRDHLTAWSAIQEADTSLDSPYFTSEFTLSLGRARDDVEIAVCESGGEVVGFLPYHRTAGNIGRPIGMRLCDLQGAIVRNDLQWRADHIVRSCGLAAWHFDHLIASQSGFQPFQWTVASSPYMDLSQGFAAYCRERRRAGSDLVTQILRKSRKVERELGPLQFTTHSLQQADFETLIDWKTQQHRNTGVLEIFRYPWVVSAARQVWNTRSDRFAGLLSTLSAGEHLLAVHLGMRSSQVWHLWFPTYDRQFAQYSPGLIMLLEMARVAPELGLHRIDLGKGPERYKVSLMSGALLLAEGSVDCRPVMRAFRRGWHGTKRWIQASQLRAPLSAPLRVTRRMRQWLAFR